MIKPIVSLEAFRFPLPVNVRRWHRRLAITNPLLGTFRFAQRQRELLRSTSF